MTPIPVATMRELDRRAGEEFGLQPIQLMENAGRTIAEFIIAVMQAPAKVSFLCGRGHNGGDGLVAARHLHNRGIEVEIVLAKEDVRELTAHQLYTVREIGIAEAEFPAEDAGLVVDCLLGYGAKGRPDERLADLLIVANALQGPKLAVDIPTGLDVSTGEWAAPCFHHATVLTLGMLKPHLLQNPKIDAVYVGDIGLPAELFERMGIDEYPLFAHTCYVRATKSN